MFLESRLLKKVICFSSYLIQIYYVHQIQVDLISLVLFIRITVD